MYDDKHFQEARSDTCSPDSPFSLISPLTLSNHLLLKPSSLPSPLRFHSHRPTFYVVLLSSSHAHTTSTFFAISPHFRCLLFFFYLLSRVECRRLFSSLRQHDRWITILPGQMVLLGPSTYPCPYVSTHCRAGPPPYHHPSTSPCKIIYLLAVGICPLT